MAEFCSELKKRRIQARLTQTELAKRVGISSRCVQNWEAGAVQPLPLYREATDRVLGAALAEAKP